VPIKYNRQIIEYLWDIIHSRDDLCVSIGYRVLLAGFPLNLDGRLSLTFPGFQRKKLTNSLNFRREKIENFQVNF